MKRTVLSLVLCVFSAAAFAQDELPSSAALERAIVVEEIEHDRRQALALYAAIADDEALADSLRRHAALRLGRAHAALGDLDAARVALERAAAGDDALAALARAELADPGADEERARLLREEARRWIEKVPGNQNSSNWHSLTKFDPTSNLVWIGEAAVPEIVRAIETARAENDRREWLISTYTGLLWHIGGPQASAWLRTVRDGDDLELRRLAAWGLLGSHARTDEMVALAQTFLADPDPEGEVVTAALATTGTESRPTWHRYELDAVFALLDSPVPGVRAVVLRMIRSDWHDLRHEGGAAATMDQLVPALTRALDDVNPAVGQAALELLQTLGVTSPASRALVVERLPELGPDFRLSRRSADQVTAQEPAALGLLPMLRAVGPASGTAQNGRDQAVAFLVQTYLHLLDRASAELVLEYLRLGYDADGLAAEWVARECGPEEAERICATMLEPSAFDALFVRLNGIELTPACYPYLARAERILAERDPASLGRDPISLQSALLKAFGRTGTPEAVARLLELLEANPTMNQHRMVTYGLLHAAALRQDPDVIAALKVAISIPLTGELNPFNVGIVRQAALARLVHHGDPEVVRYLPAAHVADLAATTIIQSLFPDLEPFWRRSSDGVEWLTLWRQDGDSVIAFAGYDEAELASIWDALLALPDGEDWNSAWSTLDEALRPDWSSRTNWWQRRLPGRYLDPPPAIVTVAARRWKQRVEQASEPFWTGDRNGPLLLLDIGRRGEVTDADALAAIAELHAACFDSPEAEIRSMAIDMLPAEPDEAGRAAVRRALGDADVGVARRAFDRTFDARQPVTRELFVRVLESPSEELRTVAISTLAPLVEGGAVELVKAMLDDESSEVRIAACRFLGTQVDADSVPELLTALTDLDEHVRAAAAEALRSIRFYHDERAHWDRVFAGTELSANGAAEALLKQAGSASTREVRLLAIRSLGTLGVAETLPFLIEWTADPDPELASAAREAITRIHASGD